MDTQEEITQDDIDAFLEGGTLASRMAEEMGYTHDLEAMKRLIRSHRSWERESAPFNQAVRESSIIRTGDMELRINARDDD